MPSPHQEGHGESGGSVVLFYRYCALPEESVPKLAQALKDLCSSYGLLGRVLIAGGQEGLNGTLGGPTEALKRFVSVLAHPFSQGPGGVSEAHRKWREAISVPTSGGDVNPLVTIPESEFKWSTYRGESPPFADLFIREVKEIIGAGGVLAKIPISEASQGYLTPEQWHQVLQQESQSKEVTGKQKTVVIDCRNRREVAIGRFDVPGLIDPDTKRYVRSHKVGYSAVCVCVIV